MPNPDGYYIVAGEQFRTKEEVEARLSFILKAGPLGSDVAPSDRAFVEALTSLRPEKLAEIGERKIVRVIRDKWQFKRSRCIWVILDRGEKIDISLHTKAIGRLKPGIDPADR